MINPSKRKILEGLYLAGLLGAGGIALVKNDPAAGCFWALWAVSVMNALAKPFPQPEGVALVRNEMAPTDLPPNAKIPVTLMTKEERERQP
jgi:hypothetical protein